MSVHGPGHLFCEGCSFTETALARAAWAGWSIASGSAKDAMHYAEGAREAMGKLFMNTPYVGRDGELRVYAVGGTPTSEEIEFVIEMLTLSRDSFKRGEERRASATAVQSGNVTDVPNEPAL